MMYIVTTIVSEYITRLLMDRNFHVFKGLDRRMGGGHPSKSCVRAMGSLLRSLACPTYCASASHRQRNRSFSKGYAKCNALICGALRGSQGREMHEGQTGIVFSADMPLARRCQASIP